MTYTRSCGGTEARNDSGVNMGVPSDGCPCVCVPQMRGMSSALSAASSACDHMRDWIHGTPPGTFVSMGVFSDGSYNAPKVGHGP